MRKTTKLMASLALAAALGTSLAACSSSPEENTASACDSYAAFVGAVAEVKTSLSSSSTVGEIKAARDKVTTAYTELNTALDKVGSDRADTLAAAWKDLDSAISGMDEGLTVPEAKEALQGDLGKVESAQTGLDADLKC